MYQFRFREPIKLNTSNPEPVYFSLDGRFIGSIFGNTTIEVRDCLSLQIVSRIECPDVISTFLWSPDSKLIAILMDNQKSIQVYFVENLRTDEDNLTIPYMGLSSGIINIEKMLWSPDSKSILLCGVYASQLFIFDIGSKSVHRLPSPKNSETAFSFSPIGNMLAILVRSSNGHDEAVVFDLNTYRRKTTINLNTLDAKTVYWTSDGLTLIVIDEISHHLLQIINMKTQRVVDYSAYDGYLGITNAIPCQNSKIIAVGGYDGYVRLLVSSDWKVLAEFLHETNISGHSISVYVEDDSEMRFVEPPVQLEKNEFLSGITNLEWSNSNKFLATTNAETPKAVFIWDIETISLVYVLVFKKDVEMIKWSTKEDILAISTGSNFLALWSQQGKVWLVRDNKVNEVNAIQWKQDGSELLVIDNSSKNFVVMCK
ncbi:WD repeat-containing protein WRAP73 [Histomonas meleagridis]|uniref:WD repeat-containing protein WRAP73 n=1 Tax=Histomonas meleagridis TaxID=135588 RepID=UPI00355A5A80|nr:WD repeat-containing protein WRAP73 [Histomonas meleagridis]KAH0801125.1 WD repeat-containing protein WRAP73 [Histomonas meleagridis]